MANVTDLPNTGAVWLVQRIGDRYRRLGDTPGARIRALPDYTFGLVSTVFNSYKKPLVRKALNAPKALLSPLINSPLGNALVAGTKRPSMIRPKRARPNVLILRNQNLPLAPDMPSMETRLLDNTLTTSGLADFQVMRYDVDFGLAPFSDIQLIRRCIEQQPDLVLLSAWGPYPTHPSIHAVNFIRHRLNIPVGVIWWDTCSHAFWGSVHPYIDAFDFHYVAENPRFHCIDKAHPLFSRFIGGFAPLDTNLFCDQHGVRDIAVSFVGQAGAYRNTRAEMIRYLTDNGVDGYFRFSGKNDYLSDEAYAEIMQRSHMCINFSYSVDSHQLKGRVLETMYCGALLLESDNDQTSLLFEPMKDYVTYTSKEDLLDKIRYFLDHPAEMEAIAQSGARKARAMYGPDVFWSSIFDRLPAKADVFSCP